MNTLLLDTIAQSHRGTTAYVRPGQNIEAEVSDFYEKISTPVLANLQPRFGFAPCPRRLSRPVARSLCREPTRPGGTLSGWRQRRALTITGQVNGADCNASRTAIFRLRESGGDSFIARLWATRRVGYLLGQIRLHGEDQELVDEIVDLAVRHGIITPYTSFLVQEDDILSPRVRADVAREQYGNMSAPAATQDLDRGGAGPMAAAQEPGIGGGAESGAAAVDRSIGEEKLRKAETAPEAVSDEIKTVGEKSFLLKNGIWTDTTFNPDAMSPRRIVFGSDDYFALIVAHPDWGRHFSVGRQVIVVLDGQAYQVVEE